MLSELICIGSTSGAGATAARPDLGHGGEGTIIGIVTPPAPPSSFDGWFHMQGAGWWVVKRGGKIHHGSPAHPLRSFAASLRSPLTPYAPEYTGAARQCAPSHRCEKLKTFRSRFKQMARHFTTDWESPHRVLGCRFANQSACDSEGDARQEKNKRTLVSPKMRGVPKSARRSSMATTATAPHSVPSRTAVPQSKIFWPCPPAAGLQNYFSRDSFEAASVPSLPKLCRVQGRRIAG